MRDAITNYIRFLYHCSQTSAAIAAAAVATAVAVAIAAAGHAVPKEKECAVDRPTDYSRHMK